MKMKQYIYIGNTLRVGMSFRGKMLGKIVLLFGIFFYATIPCYEAYGPFWSASSDAILHEGMRPESMKTEPMDWKPAQEGSGEPLLLYNLQFEEPLGLNFGRFYF